MSRIIFGWLACCIILLSSCTDDNKFLSNYSLIMNDNFCSFKLNKCLWNTHLNVFGQKHSRYHNTQYLNFISDEDVIIRDGRLLLRNKKVITEDKIVNTTHSYTSGMISSHDKFFFTYGYIEMKARYPKGKGVWPCFWLMPQDGTWPPEFDIAEFYASKRCMHLGLCYGNFPTIQWDSDANNDENFEGTFNTYGLLWEPNKATWYQNGKVKRTIEGSHVPNKPMYIIISNGVSSKIGPSGTPEETTVFPNYLEVKYVRVFQKKN